MTLHPYGSMHARHPREQHSNEHSNLQALRMKMSSVSEFGEELPLFLEALSQKKPGENGAIVFARALSGATPDSFAEALQRTSKLFYLCLRDKMKISVREARLLRGGFEEAARREYKRLRMASGATNTGSA
jgi:hypothetical protein